MMPVPPAGSGRLPVSDADRDRLIQLLGEHYARGDFDDAELDRRTGIVLTARFLDEAAGVLADLPALVRTIRGSGPGAGPARTSKRHAQAARPGPGWVPTGELFRDPSSGAVTRVWVDPADGSRHYVPEPGA